jgi:hypothetical protein
MMSKIPLYRYQSAHHQGFREDDFLTKSLESVVAVSLYQQFY